MRAQKRLDAPGAMHDVVVQPDDVGEDRHREQQVEQPAHPVVVVHERQHAGADDGELDHLDAGDERGCAIRKRGREQPHGEGERGACQHRVATAGFDELVPADGDQDDSEHREGDVARRDVDRRARQPEAGARLVGGADESERRGQQRAPRTASGRRHAAVGGRDARAPTIRVRLPSMKIIFLTGIWPPDVGGPATHGPDFAAFLRDRGHSVRVVTMGDSEPTERPVPVDWVTASVRSSCAIRSSLPRASGSHVRPTSSMQPRPMPPRRPRRSASRSSQSSSPTRPSSARGATASTAGPAEEFERDRAHGSRRCAGCATSRSGRAGRIVVPSRYLARDAIGWGLDPERVEVLVNPAPPPLAVRPSRSVLARSSSPAASHRPRRCRSRSTRSRSFPTRELILVGDGEERGRFEQTRP